MYRKSRASLEELGWAFLAAQTSFDSGPVEMLNGDLEAAEREPRSDYESLERMGETNTSRRPRRCSPRCCTGRATSTVPTCHRTSEFAAQDGHVAVPVAHRLAKGPGGSRRHSQMRRSRPRGGRH